jgi:cytochrome d ubiquinol oxidase subunit II
MIVALAGIAAALAIGLLWTRRYRAARFAAAAQVTLVVLGWGASQHPWLMVPDFTIGGAAAPPATLRLLIGALIVGSLLLFPSLWILFRSFKGSRPFSPVDDR